MAQQLGQHAPQILIDAQYHVNRALDSGTVGDAMQHLAWALDGIIYYLANGAYGYKEEPQK